MSDEPEITENLELDTPEEIEGEEGEQGHANDDGEEEYSIEIDGEAEEDETPLVKQLRQRTRDQERELSEYRKSAKPKVELGPKPTLEDCEYDEDKYEAAIEKWHEDKRQVETADAEEQRQAEVRNEEAQRRVVNYQSQMASLPLPPAEKDAAHQTVAGSLPHILQAAILNYCDNPAKIVLALAKHPAKLEQLASEPDPIKFILKIKDIERNLKVVNRKKPPSPESETIQSGSASLSTSVDKELEKLEKEADRTKDRTKLVAYKKKLKAKAA